MFCMCLQAGGQSFAPPSIPPFPNQPILKISSNAWKRVAVKQSAGSTSHTAKGQERFSRAKTIGEGYDEEALRHRIEHKSMAPPDATVIACTYRTKRRSKSLLEPATTYIRCSERTRTKNIQGHIGKYTTTWRDRIGGAHGNKDRPKYHRTGEAC